MSAPIPADLKRRYEHLSTYKPMEVAVTDIYVREYQLLIERIATLEAALVGAQWKPITIDTKFDKDSHYVIAGFIAGQLFYESLEGRHFQRKEAARHLLTIGRTHYRPITPPGGSDGK